MPYKQLFFRSEAREKIVRGAAALADAVRVTLGPKSKCVLIGKKWGRPIVCNDGVTCRCLVGFEERAAAIYSSLALRFARNRDLSWFWLEMSMEERGHAVLLEFCGCEDLFAGNMPDRRAIRELSDLFSGLEERASRRNLSIDEAFLIAAELEASEVNVIYTRLVGPVKGTPYIVRKKIETLGSNHMQSLIRGARRFRVTAPTMAKLIQLKNEKLRRVS